MGKFIFSLFLALFVVPILLTYMEKIKFFDQERYSGTGYSNAKLLQRYKDLLTWSYAVPRRAIMISLALPLLGFLMFPFLKADFFPELDRNMFKVFIELPQNSNVRTTEKRVKEIRKSIAQSEIAGDDFWFIGRKLPRILYNVIGGDSGLGSNNIAQGVYFAPSYKEMKASLPGLARRLNQENPDLKIIQATNNAELAVRFGRKAKTVIDTPEYQKIFNSSVTEDFKEIWIALEKESWIKIKENEIILVEEGEFYVPLIQSLISKSQVDIISKKQAEEKESV